MGSANALVTAVSAAAYFPRGSFSDRHSSITASRVSGLNGLRRQRVAPRLSAIRRKSGLAAAGSEKAVLCLPLGPHAARRAAAEVVAAEQVPLVADLLCRLAACISEQSISVDLLAQVSAADLIITQAAGVLRRSR